MKARIRVSNPIPQTNDEDLFSIVISPFLSMQVSVTLKYKFNANFLFGKIGTNVSSKTATPNRDYASDYNNFYIGAGIGKFLLHKEVKDGFITIPLSLNII